MKNRNEVEFSVCGDYALFSDPITRVGGEKASYPVPTYEALKGVLSSIYWKPTLVWFIDCVRILKPIQMETKGVRPMLYNKRGNDLSYYTYLKDCAYQVKAHFEWNDRRPDLIGDRNEGKHYQIALRCIEKGGRRDVFLGTRECQAFVEPCRFGEGAGVYDGTAEISFGLMLHGLSYPDETDTSGYLAARFWRPVMKKGIIRFIRPEECTMTKKLRPMAAKEFSLEKGNFSGWKGAADDGIVSERL